MTATERLYYTDASLVHFSATVVGIEADGRHVVLDRTAFYPTSGGQPFDTGALGNDRVIDVVDEESRIVHVCEHATTHHVGDVIEGVIDWARRFDHMQQHTGQHLLSAVLADRYGWHTLSVHFGATTNTVDVTAASVSAEQLLEIEQLVNDAACASHAVGITFEDATHAVGLRKASDRDGILRIVTIDGVDRSACGGTHVSHTGAIGAIMLRRVEKTKGHSRLEFVCGRRALAVARADAALLTQTTRLFTAAPEDLPSLVASQQQRLTDAERERKRLAGELAVHHAATRWADTTPDADGVRRFDLGDVGASARDAESLVLALLERGACRVLATSAASKSVLFGASEGSGVDAGATLRAALQSAGGRGGGSPRVAQGSVTDAALLGLVAEALGFSP